MVCQPAPHLSLVGRVKFDAVIVLTGKVVAVLAVAAIVQAIVLPLERQLINVHADVGETLAHPTALVGTDPYSEQLLNVMRVAAQAEHDARQRITRPSRGDEALDFRWHVGSLMSADLVKLTHIFLRVAVMRYSDAVLNDERRRLRQVNHLALQDRVVRTRSELKLSIKAVGNARVLMTQHSLRFAIDDLPSA